MKARWIVSVILVTATVLYGCEFSRRYIKKPWGEGTYVPAAVCAVVGGFTGAAIESQWFSNESIRGGKSEIVDTNTGQVISSSTTHPDYPASIAIGAGGGALLCGLLHELHRILYNRPVKVLNDSDHHGPLTSSLWCNLHPFT